MSVPPCSQAADLRLFDSTDWLDHLDCRKTCSGCHMVKTCLQLALDIAGQHDAGNTNERGPDGTWAGLLWRNGRIVTAGVA